ncbi:amiloride-sensitive sodium channel subunit beta-like [Physella acuta]|uniref:amiloride-sensitive sodium channel subunit beta-like n=1 Tax=Physella acuta TaxID=109671 RepID=UPI0027DC73CB|nr:amiloride-sensitive sodium channel subunit beta-like [Physella acuta]
MLIQCAFAGRMCFQSDFVLTQWSTYGNCYTLQYPEFVSRRSGPADGIELILYLETDEYIRGISTGKGAHVVIHEQETVPFPTEEGIAIVAGTQSIIGIRQVEISRMGEPYGRCTDVKVFKEKYGVKYTRMVCQKTCEQNLIRQSCGCYDELQEEVNVILKNPLNLRPCRTRKDKKCANAIELKFGEASSAMCGCDSPCSEKKYDKTITLRQWPSPSFAILMREIICKEREGTQCVRLRNKTSTELSQEFIKLNVFFEDLNYEHLSEEADYELSQYISDIGGTIGLWVGLSLLGVVEVFKLLADVIIYLVGRLRKANRQNSYTIH